MHQQCRSAAVQTVLISALVLINNCQLKFSLEKLNTSRWNFLTCNHMLPLFYSEGLEENSQSVCLDEDNSRHIVQVLRMRSGSALQLTNGKGGMFSGEIVKENKKEVEVAIKNYERVEAPQGKISICLSLLKNANRFEWFLEKATELGISELMPIICERTERQHFRANRM